MKESPKTDPMLGMYQLLNIPTCIDIELLLKKSYKSGGNIEFLKKNSHEPIICKGFFKGMILRSKVDFWMICARLGMKPNVALILNWS